MKECCVISSLSFYTFPGLHRSPCCTSQPANSAMPRLLEASQAFCPVRSFQHKVFSPRLSHPPIQKLQLPAVNLGPFDPSFRKQQGNKNKLKLKSRRKMMACPPRTSQLQSSLIKNLPLRVSWGPKQTCQNLPLKVRLESPHFSRRKALKETPRSLPQ